MARANIISIMQSKRIDAEFNYDMLTSHGKISNYLTWDDIFNLNKIATSKKLSSKLKEKYKLIDQIMVPRGFKRFASGTNRVVYKYLDDYSFVFKIAIDAVALSDNIDEMNNQVYIKPFVCKCFDVTPCGTVGMFERIDPITSKQQFLSIAEDVFDIINQKLIGKYILEDIGSKYFMNWGIRLGFGPVLLDYPYMFELDGKKIYCNKDDIYSPTGKCGGLIDYDIGFNNLICEKCGKRYLAIELKKYKKEYSIMLKGDDTMKVSIRKGKETIKKFNHSITTSDVISKESAKKMARVCNNGEDDKYKYTPNYSLMGEESSTMRVSVKVPTSEIKEDEDRNPDKLNINEKKESETIPNQSEFNQNTSVQNSPEIDESFGIAKDIHEINISKDSEKESDEKIVEKEISMSIDPIPEVTESEEKIVEDEEDDDEEIQIIPRNNNILDQEVVDEF